MCKLKLKQYCPSPRSSSEHTFIRVTDTAPPILTPVPPRLTSTVATQLRGPYIFTETMSRNPQLIPSAAPQPGSLSPLPPSPTTLQGVYFVVRGGDGSTAVLQPAANMTGIVPGSNGMGGGVTVIHEPSLHGADSPAPTTPVVTSPSIMSAAAVLHPQAVIPVSQADKEVFVSRSLGTNGRVNGTVISSPFINGATLLQAGGQPLQLVHSVATTTGSPVTMVTNANSITVPSSTLSQPPGSESRNGIIRPAKPVLLTSPPPVRVVSSTMPAIKSLVHGGKSSPPPLVPLSPSSKILAPDATTIKRTGTEDSYTVMVNGGKLSSPCVRAPMTVATTTQVSSPPMTVLIPARNGSDASSINTLIPVTYNPNVTSPMMPIYRLGTAATGGTLAANGMQSIQILTPITLAQRTIA